MTNEQVQVLFAKYVYLNDIEAVKELGAKYPCLSNQVEDVCGKHARKVEKLNKLLSLNDLDTIKG